MAGGQSLELNLDCPLGIYDIGLDCACSLFEIFVKKLDRLSSLSGSEKKMVKLYIMANSQNKEDIKNHFKNNDYFGYGSENTFFFSQDCFAVVDENGKIVLKNEGNIHVAPRGNGAVYQ
jgi:UDP-N-acetylglucosamine/UDP-N-acetylgalactosamine diphosphorylase